MLSGGAAAPSEAAPSEDGAVAGLGGEDLMFCAERYVSFYVICNSKG